MASEPTGIGDVNSDAKGSGARFNIGKIQYELLPLFAIVDWLDQYVSFEHGTPQWYAMQVLRDLARFQQRYDDALSDALFAATSNTPAMESFESATRVFDYGRKKYSEWNWAKGQVWSVPLACAVRHCLKILRGELVDTESGELHMGHVQCNLLILATFRSTFPEGDDRPKWLRPN